MIFQSESFPIENSWIYIFFKYILCSPNNELKIFLLTCSKYYIWYWKKFLYIEISIYIFPKLWIYKNNGIFELEKEVDVILLERETLQNFFFNVAIFKLNFNPVTKWKLKISCLSKKIDCLSNSFLCKKKGKKKTIVLRDIYVYIIYICNVYCNFEQKNM